jgi:hypothetical protein
VRLSTSCPKGVLRRRGAGVAALLATTLAPAVARACPACAGTSGFRPLQLVLLLLPLVIAAIAIRAILRALDE